MQSGVSIHRKDHAELRSILMNIKPQSKQVRRSKGRRAGRRGRRARLLRAEQQCLTG